MTAGSMTLPPAFLCPALSVDGDYRDRRRRRQHSGHTVRNRMPGSRCYSKGASEPDDSFQRASTSKLTICTDLRHEQQEPLFRRYAQPHSWQPTHRSRPSSFIKGKGKAYASTSSRASASIASLPATSSSAGPYPSVTTAAAVELAPPSPPLTAAATEAAEAMQASLHQGAERLSPNLQVCQDVAIDVLNNPVGLYPSGGEREDLDECIGLLLDDRQASVDTVEIIGALVTAAYIRTGRDEAPSVILDTIQARLLTHGKRLSRQRWKAAIIEALRRKAYTLANQILELAGEARVINARDDKVNVITRLHDFIDLAEMDLGTSPTASQREAIQTLRLEFKSLGGAPSPRVFSTLVSLQARFGQADRIKTTIEAQQRLLPEADYNVLLRHVVRMHPCRRHPGLMLEILGADQQGHHAAFSSLVEHFAALGDSRNLLRTFRMFGLTMSGGKSRLFAPYAPVCVNMIKHLYRRCTPNTVLHFFRKAVLYCSHGDLTLAFHAVCWAFEEHNDGATPVALGFQLFGIDATGLEDPKRPLGSNFQAPAHTIVASRNAYASLIKCCGLLDNVEELVIALRAILLDIFKRQKQPNSRVIRAVTGILPRTLRHASWTETSRLLQRLAEDPGDALDAQRDHMRLFIDHLQRHGDLDSVILPHRKALQITSSPDASDENHAWVTETRLEPPSPDSVNALPLKSDTRAAHEMDLSKPLTPRGYALRLRIYGVVRRDYASAQAVFQSMLRHGVQPTMRHIAVIVESLVLQNRIDDARAVREGAFTHNPLDMSALRIMTAIIRAFARQGKWQAVLEELRLIDNLLIKPDDALFAIVSSAVRHAHMDGLARSRPVDKLAYAAERLLARRNTGDTEVVENEVQAMTMPPRMPDARTVTGLLQAKSRDGRLFEAQQNVSRALDSGLRPDSLMREILRKTHRYIVREARWAGYEPEDLVRAVEGTLPAWSETYKKFHTPADATIGSAAEWRLTRRQRKRWAGPPKHPRELGHALVLSLENMARVSVNAADTKELLAREKRARTAMTQLILDAFGSTRLWDEAQARVQAQGQHGDQQKAKAQVAA